MVSKRFRGGVKFTAWKEQRKSVFNISDSQLTDALAGWLEEENLNKHFDDRLKKEKKKRKRLLF